MARPHDRPARLNLQHSLHMQQPQALFSPALPTGIQSGFYPPPFPGGPNALQTPMQPFFNQGPPHAPGRPTHQTRNSIAHFPGQQQPNGFGTPVSGHFPRPSMMLGPGQPFLNPNGPHRPHKRQMSIGGPPKAVLGGPARKVSPNPIAVAAAAAVSKKKITVNLPKETLTVEGTEGDAEKAAETTRADFARVPLPHNEYEDVEVQPPELMTREIFPPDEFVKGWPDNIDVFLPRKETWDVLKQQVIEAKLEKLGVERGSGSGSNIPHIFAPHARAASISSPADPALLLFKLNKLQASQQSSVNNSLAPSPQLPNQPFGLSPSPNQRRPSPGNLFHPRHGHTMSLAQPPSFGSYDPIASSFNPFASSNGSMDSDRPKSAVSEGGLRPSQPDLGSSPILRLDSRPDFIRGFGLEIPEEEEPEEGDNVSVGSDHTDGNAGDTEEDVAGVEEEEDMELEGVPTASHSRLHSRRTSRHVSRVSAALSLRSIGGNHGAIEPHPEGYVPPEREVPSDYEDVAAVQEWTGSEEEGYNAADTSDDESLGEFSNPSDEERARRQRVEKRMRRRASRDRTDDVLDLEDHPRRIPNFPRPPESLDLVYVPTQREEFPDDIVSNPSEEDVDGMYRNPHHPHFVGFRNGSGEFYVPQSNGALSPRFLPPLPHSRGSSQQYSIHDPALAHSRDPSHASYYPSQNPLLQQHSPQPSLSVSSGGKKDTLNPFAKPFVFGKPLPLEQPKPATPDTVVSSSRLGHARADSFGKTLNVAAPEFKPRGLPSSAEFTFRQPDAPPMPVPPPGFPQPELAVPRHEPAESLEASPAFRTQGREKRPRLDAADMDEAVEEEGESMTSFRFPPALDSPQTTRKHKNSNSGNSLGQNGRATFSFEAFSNVAHFPTIRPTVAEPEGEVSMDMDEEDEAEATKENIPPPPRAAETSFKYEDEEGQEFILPPLSASKPKRTPLPLDFKTKTVPAGLFRALVNSNGDTRRGGHSRIGSREFFDHISRPSMDDSHVQMITRSHRMVTDPIRRSSSAGVDDVFNSGLRHERRRSSLPEALIGEPSAPISPISSIGPGPQDLTSRLEAQHISDMLAQMFDVKFTALRRELLGNAMIADLEDSAARSMEDTHMEARGEMDFQMIKDLIDEGNKEILGVVRQEVHDLLVLQQQGSRSPSSNHSMVKDVVAPIVESVGDKTTRAVVEAISEFSARQDAIDRATPARERDLLLNDIVGVLTPVLNGFQADPIDYDFLTSKLTQALIDLASDKRETAALIGDNEAMAAYLISEIKEQVADLVVELRDKAFNVDTISTKVTESVSQMVDNLNKASDEQQKEAKERHEDLRASVLAIPSQLESKIVAKSDSAVLELRPILESLLLAHQKAFASTMNSIPEVLQFNIVNLQNTIAELIASRDLNSDYQIQLTKARAAHGQARKLAVVEGERDRLRKQVTKGLERSALESRTAELEESLSKALARLQEADAATHADKKRIAELEKAAKDSMTDSQSSKAKVESLEMQVTFANRDRDAATTALEEMKKQHDAILAQQSHWEELRQTSEKIDALAKLVGQADHDELQDLRRYRDQTKPLETEHTALQKRLKELETRAANNDRVAATAKSSLVQAQQRSDEWERRAREYEGELEITKTQLEQSEQTQSQLDADYSTLKIQFEEREAEERLNQVSLELRGSDIAGTDSFDSRRIVNKSNMSSSRLWKRRSSDSRKSSSRPAPRARLLNLKANGHGNSAVDRTRLSPYTPPTNGASPTQPSVWDSRHAPSSDRSKYGNGVNTSIHAPKSRYPNLGPSTPKNRPGYPTHFSRANAPSPSPSVVSAAPTLGDDGWYS
ncbi:hypothetical protein BKA70DRAFT_1368012 [Coprinopsis sp. MPI-PUGE-AT-0042]|nr:hypothetical protein BKA70DRAFT_1368012 [Coprinopsis sp. MPI-PUGE-AT-0042]